jgi:hypothetical protein
MGCKILAGSSYREVAKGLSVMVWIVSGVALAAGGLAVLLHGLVEAVSIIILPAASALPLTSRDV